MDSQEAEQRNDAQQAPKRRRKWRAWLAYGVVGCIALFLGWSAVATSLVQGFDAKKERDPETGILRGAEPRDLGPRDARGAVLFIHGFNGCPNNYNDFPDRVAAAGWRAKAMLLPGHGTSPLEFEKQTPDDLLNAALAEVDALKAEHGKVVVAGHSMGGAIATLVAHQRDIDGLVLCAPYYGLRQRWFYPVEPERFIKSAAPMLRWLRGIEGMQPVAKQENAPKIISYTWVSTQGALTAVELGERARQPHVLHSIDMPVLLLNGLKDSLTPYETAFAAMAKMQAPVKVEHVLPEADHVLFWDYGAEEACDALLAFLGTLQ